MSESIIETPSLKEKRGNTILVLAILSWVWMGISVFGILIALSRGVMSAEELEQEEYKLLEATTPEVIEIMGKDYIKDTIEILHISNDNFYVIQFSSIVTLLVGFVAVWWMFKLKKKGYYLYLLYSVLPVITSLIFFNAGFLIVFGVLFNLFFAFLFCLLYGLQMKRMS